MEESSLLLLLSYSSDEKATALLDHMALRLPHPGVTNGLGARGVLQASVEAAGLLKRRERAAAGNAWYAAEAHFEKALRLAAEMPHRVEQLEVRRWYARMLLDRKGPGGVNRARILLAEARQAFAEIGMRQHIACVDIMLNELGI